MGPLQATDLAHVNAVLNGIAAVFLAFGYAAIRRRDVARHRRAMLAATAVSTLFLISYLAYHLQVGSVRFTHQGPARTVYFVVLVSHIILAAVTLPLVLKTLYHALRDQRERHRRWAKWTWPIWMYVSVTGVVVYLMLYHLYPPV